MTFSRAQQEFQVRYYLWAISEWEREINGSFPNPRFFKAGPVIQQLEKNGQMAEARALLQIFRADATKVLGETYFDHEKSLLSQLDAVFQPIGSTFEEKTTAKKQAGEKVKFVSKPKLQKAITEKYRTAFGDQCVDRKFDNEFDLSSNFDMKCSGWIVSTNFWFGLS